MTKKGHQNFWRPKCGKLLKICGYQNSFLKNGPFFQTHVDVHKGKGDGQDHMDALWTREGRGAENPIYVWTS